MKLLRASQCILRAVTICQLSFIYIISKRSRTERVARRYMNDSWHIVTAMKKWIKFSIQNLTLGTMITFLYGTVKTGFWPKWTVLLVLRYDNEEPEACFMKTGVPRLYISFASVTFQKSLKEKFVCFGSGKIKFYSGLKTKTSIF